MFIVQKGLVTNASASKFVPRRGRPSAKQVAAIDHTILMTARRLFLEEGYETTPMEGIAAAAGVSKGTLYARYPSKEAMFEAVVKESVERWSAESASEDHLLTEDLSERLCHHARSIARSQLNPEIRAFQRLLQAHGDRFPSLAKAMYDHGYLFVVSLITTDIVAAAKRDDVPVKDADGVARHMVSAIIGWFLQESADRTLTLAEIEAFGTRAVDILIAGRSAW